MGSAWAWARLRRFPALRASARQGQPGLFKAVERLELLERRLGTVAKDTVRFAGKVVQFLQTRLQVGHGGFALRIAIAVLQRSNRGGGRGEYRFRGGGLAERELLLVCVLDDAVLAPRQKEPGRPAARRAVFFS